LTQDEDTIAASIAAEYQTSDPWQEVILPELSGLKETTTRSILDQVLKIEPGRQDRGMLMRVADILRMAGWRKARKGLERLRIWLAPDQPDPPDQPVLSEVGHTSNSSEANSQAIADQPDQPFGAASTTKQKENHSPPLISTFPGLSFFQIGRSGGSGGSKEDGSVENSALLARPTSRPTSESGASSRSEATEDDYEDIPWENES
jgi:hypothetical protein